MQYAISYSRFSTGRQQHGTSLSRQTEMAEDYCQQHNLTLLESFHDAGRSGFHAKHLEEGGQLKLLLDKVNDGTIPKGTHLLVEQTDRLTRQAVLEGLQVIQQLVLAGLVVVTLDDGEKYDADAGFGKLVMLLARLQRGHDESKAKSDRMNFAWEKKAKQLLAGELPKMRMPFWLERDGDNVRPVAQWVEVVECVFQGCIDGYGCAEIARSLNNDGITTKSGTMWTASSVTQLIRNKRLIGWHQRKESKELFKVYPPIMSIERFEEAGKALDTRVRSKGNSQKWSSALSGLGRCGACGSVLKYSGRAKYRTAVCRAAVDGGAVCSNKRSIRYKAIIVGMVAALSKGLGQQLLPKPKEQGSQRESVQHEIDGLDGQISNLVEAIGMAPNVQEIAVKLRDAQAKREDLKQKLSTMVDPADPEVERARRSLIASRDIPELVEMVLEGLKEAAAKFNILLHSIEEARFTLQDGVVRIGDTETWIEHKTIRFRDADGYLATLSDVPIERERRIIEYGTPDNARKITTWVSIAGQDLGGGFHLEYDPVDEPNVPELDMYDESGNVRMDRVRILNDFAEQLT
ncbi:recombinase family protein [Ferrimonas sediminicola]|uniref:Recombinase family protein n=1 Tax=Ferrimonas sediminicola TaxID=2569538 RepID=A0A4U1B8F3_9GAMM|nr:recombinase family protein [Ferrimonas sediminicola]TKB46865.1 recombinase family protein [Ferrimonas sediminicola]